MKPAKMAPNSKNIKQNKPNKQSNKKNNQEKNVGTKKKQLLNQKKKKTNGSCLKWFFYSFLLFVLITAALIYDTEVNGRSVFAKSATGKMLQKMGILNHVENGWYRVMGTAARGYKYIEINLPPFAKPYTQLSINVEKLLYNTCHNVVIHIKNIINAMLPVAAGYLEQYIPGLPDKIHTTATFVWDMHVTTYNLITKFFKTQVLIGNLSPENLSEALNHTRNVVVEFYYKFHKKVDTYAKLK